MTFRSIAILGLSLLFTVRPGPARASQSSGSQGPEGRSLARPADLASITLTSDGPDASVIHIAPGGRGLSFELTDAIQNERIPLPPSLRLKQTAPTRDQLALVVWMQAHRQEIAAAEARFHITRQAIAGVIAWEALENVRPISVRSVGPGKVHICNMSTLECEAALLRFCPPSGSRCPADVKGIDETVGQEVEALGLLPPKSLQERIDMLKTSAGAITYVAAILRAGADAAKDAGWDIDSDPAMLATFYRGYTVRAWRRILQTVDKTSPRLVLRDSIGNERVDEMGAWIQRSSLLLEDGVGRSLVGTRESIDSILGSAPPESVRARTDVQRLDDDYESWLRRLDAILDRAEGVRREERAAREFAKELSGRKNAFGYLATAAGVACEGPGALLAEVRQGRYTSVSMERAYLTTFLGLVGPEHNISPCQLDLLKRINDANGPVTWENLQAWGGQYRAAHPTVFQRAGRALAHLRDAASAFASSLVPDVPSGGGGQSPQTGRGERPTREHPDVMGMPAGKQLRGITSGR